MGQSNKQQMKVRSRREKSAENIRPGRIPGPPRPANNAPRPPPRPPRRPPDPPGLGPEIEVATASLGGEELSETTLGVGVDMEGGEEAVVGSVGAGC